MLKFNSGKALNDFKKFANKEAADFKQRVEQDVAKMADTNRINFIRSELKKSGYSISEDEFERFIAERTTLETLNSSPMILAMQLWVDKNKYGEKLIGPWRERVYTEGNEIKHEIITH